MAAIKGGSNSGQGLRAQINNFYNPGSSSYKRPWRVGGWTSDKENNIEMILKLYDLDDITKEEFINIVKMTYSKNKEDFELAQIILNKKILHNELP